MLFSTVVSTALLIAGTASMQLSTRDDRTVGPGDPQRTLRATWYYTCPEAGHKIREFEWRATYRRSDRKINVRAVENIDSIDEIHVKQNSFWTTWDAYFCSNVPGKMCSYVYVGRTEGTVEPDSIVMTLVTSSLQIEERPKVTETCFETSQLAPHTCPSMVGAQIRACSIEAINVAIVRPPKALMRLSTIGIHQSALSNRHSLGTFTNRLCP